jgi:predicted nuclease with TOPRIM domain
MRTHIQARLEELKKEFESGQARLRELDNQQALLRETLLRISGAIQVLNEVLAVDQTEGQSDQSPLINRAGLQPAGAEARAA